jgi:hypothetical protein
VSPFLSDPLRTIEHMLLTLDPLALSDTLTDARRTGGARAVVDVLVAALTDRRVRSDADIDAYLDELKAACRQTRRYREAIPVLQRIATLNPARRHEIAAELAVVHGHLGEPVKGVALLRTALAQQRRLSARRRSLAFCVIAEIAAMVLGQSELARELAALGRTALLPWSPPSPVIEQPELPFPERPRLRVLQGAAA